MKTKETEHKNNHQVTDYDVVLDAKFGKRGTDSRIEAEERAFAFFNGQLVEEKIPARKSNILPIITSPRWTITRKKNCKFPYISATWTTF